MQEGQRALDEAEGARATGLIGHVEAMRERALRVLVAAEQSRDHRAALQAIAEARKCLETQARLTGELSDAPVLNLTMNAEFITVRAIIMDALAPHPVARASVVEALQRLT